MKATTFSSITARQHLDAVFTALTDKIQRQVPGAECRIHAGSNDHFAWWVVARYSNPADERKIVDVSVECRRAGSAQAIQADLAREDGTVLQEFPGDGASSLSLDGGNGLALDQALQRG